MAARIIFVNSSGSDTQASGCGPSTAVYGTSAATDGTTTIDLSTDSPDLSTVSQYDLIWVDTATGRAFGEVQSVDNTAKTVTVGESLDLGSGQNWAIGGKRATLESLNNFITTVNTSQQWVIKIETDQTLTATFPSTRPPDNNVRAFVGDNGVDDTKIKLTANHSSSYCFQQLRNTTRWHNLEFVCPNNNSYLFRDNYGTVILYDSIVGSRGGSSNPNRLMNRSYLYDEMDFYRCQCFTISGGINGSWFGNYGEDSYFESSTTSTTEIFFWTKGSGSFTYKNCVFKHAGVLFHQNDSSRTFDLNLRNCIIDGAAIGARGQSTRGASVQIENTIFSNCNQAILEPTISSSYEYEPYTYLGLDPDQKWYFRKNNCFYNNTTDGVTLNSTEVALDPNYVDAANGDYTVQNAALLVGGNRRNYNGALAYESIGPFRSSATGGSSVQTVASIERLK